MTSATPPRYLLLLPPLSSPQTNGSLREAFGDTLSEVLKEVASHSPESLKAAILEIAVACPHLVNSRNTARSSLYAATQSLVAGVYKLVCTVAAKDGVNIEDADGVDVRVLLIAWSPDQAVDDVSLTGPHSYNAVATLTSLAQSGRNWQYAFGVESDAGGAMIKAFLAAKESVGDITTVRNEGTTSTYENESGTVSDSTDFAPKANEAENDPPQFHRHVAVGGTFDHIHIGHKLLLTMTLFAVDIPTSSGQSSESDACTATIGITGDQLLLNKKHREVLESWHDRYLSVMTFVDAIIDFSPPTVAGQRQVSVRDDPGPNGKSMDVHYPNGLVVQCTEIQDGAGPTITDKRISALVLSAETRSGGKSINEKRAEMGWEPMEVFEVDVLDAVDDDGAMKEGFESKLSSTAIREKLASKKRQSAL